MLLEKTYIEMVDLEKIEEETLAEELNVLNISINELLEAYDIDCDLQEIGSLDKLGDDYSFTFDVDLHSIIKDYIEGGYTLSEVIQLTENMYGHVLSFYYIDEYNTFLAIDGVN